MAAFFFRYPAGSTVSISAIGTNGATAPTTSIEVGGIGDDGNLHGVHTDNNGNVYTVDAFPATAKHVIVDSSALPTGASTSAAQTTGNASLSSIDTKATAGNASTASIDSKTPALGQALAAASVPVVLTAAQLTTLTPLTSVTVTQATGTNLHAVIDNFPATQPVSGTVAATQSGTWNITNVSGTVSLPTGASTSAAQTTGNASLSSIDTKTPALGQALAAASVPVVLTAAQLTTLTPLSTVTANQGTANGTPWNENIAQINGVTPLMGNGVTGTGSQRVTIASDNTAIPIKAASGRSLANAPVTPVDYTSTPVTSAAYVQLIASTTSATNLVEIFDSSGVTLYLAVGAAASEVNQFVITPGGNGQVPLSIPAGSRLSVKATGTSATVGILVVNLYT